MSLLLFHTSGCAAPGPQPQKATEATSKPLPPEVPAASVPAAFSCAREQQKMLLQVSAKPKSSAATWSRKRDSLTTLGYKGM